MIILTESILLSKTFDETSSHEIKESLDTNIYSYGMFSKLLIKNTLYKRAYERKRSAFITVSDILSKRPQPSFTLYSATKSFLLFFTIALGYEMKEKKFFSGHANSYWSHYVN